MGSLAFFSDLFLDGSPVRLRVMFSALGGVVRGVKAVSVGDMRVVCGFFVISLFVVFGGLTVVRSSMLVMVCRFFVVFCSFMVHRGSLFLGDVCAQTRKDCRFDAAAHQNSRRGSVTS